MDAKVYTVGLQEAGNFTNEIQHVLLGQLAILKSVQYVLVGRLVILVEFPNGTHHGVRPCLQSLETLFRCDPRLSPLKRELAKGYTTQPSLSTTTRASKTAVCA